MNWKTTESWSRGQMVEEMFGELLAQRDPDYRRSTRKEQFAHIDYHSSLGTMDVKARKRMSRKSKKLQDEFTWLEFRNVRGNIGWLCSGSDIIAFERKQDFVLIDRYPLLQFAEDRCDLTDFVEESSDAIYKAYTREGRQDLISIVSMDDMMTELPHTIWDKQ